MLYVYSLQIACRVQGRFTRLAGVAASVFVAGAEHAVGDDLWLAVPARPAGQHRQLHLLQHTRVVLGALLEHTPAGHGRGTALEAGRPAAAPAPVRGQTDWPHPGVTLTQ